jgi:ankyrin repeat protein
MSWIKKLFGRSAMATESHTSTPLHRAAEASKVDEVRRLLADGASVHALDGKSNTPLRLATDVRVAELLLAAGADVNAPDHEGLMPLHKAAYVCNDGLALLYLKHGAAVDPSTHPMTPLTRGVRSGCSNYLMALFLKHGANPNVRDDVGITPMNHVNAQTMQGLFMLLAAINNLLTKDDEGLVAQSRQLRDRVIELLDDTMLKGAEPPGERSLDMGGAATRELWDRTVSQRYNLMRQQFQVLVDSIPLESPELWDQLRSEQRSLISELNR